MNNCLMWDNGTSAKHSVSQRGSSVFCLHRNHLIITSSQMASLIHNIRVYFFCCDWNWHGDYFYFALKNAHSALSSPSISHPHWDSLYALFSFSTLHIAMIWWSEKHSHRFEHCALKEFNIFFSTPALLLSQNRQLERFFGVFRL